MARPAGPFGLPLLPERHAERTSGRTESLWTGTCAPSLTKPLAQALSCDVAVVGGGMAGVTTAYLLAREGADVALFEDGAIGSGETGRTTAHFTNALDDRYRHLASLHGEEGAAQAAASHTFAIGLAEDIVRREGIACGARRVDGYLAADPTDTLASLEKEFRACRKAGLDVEWLDAPPLGFSAGPAIRFPDQLQLHPLQYLAGLVKSIRRDGGQVYTATHVRKMEDGAFEANGHKVKAKRLLVTTNTPVHSKVALHAKQASYRTYVLAARIPRAEAPDYLFWDTGNQKEKPFHPYHYVRSAAIGRDTWLVAGGEDHKTGHAVDGDPYAVLLAWVEERFPVEEVGYAWSGQVAEPYDGLGYLGADTGKEKVGLVTGDSGNGMTHTTLGAWLLAEQTLGRKPEWSDLYSPGRKPTRAVAALLREASGFAAKYADYVKPGRIASPADLGRGEGGVVRGRNPTAHYRDEAGRVWSRSAVCPHLGCLVRWNPLERSFDCPCHGSRFTGHGVQVNAPSVGEMAEAKGDGKEGKERKAAQRSRRKPRKAAKAKAR